MNGVRRIVLVKDGVKVWRKRAPIEFEQALEVLEDAVGGKRKVKVACDGKTGEISDQKSYQKWLDLAGYHGLSIQIGKSAPLPSPKPKKPSKSSPVLPSKRPVPKYSLVQSNPKKIQKIPQVLPQAKVQNSLTTPPQSIFSAPNQSNLMFPSQSISFPQTPPIDLENSLCYIRPDCNLNIYNLKSKFKKTINIPTLQQASRLLVTESGIMVTGGKNMPYQVILITANSEIVNLVSMWNPRYWHSMGYIDGYPAVAVGAISHSPTKVFLNSVEVYKDKAWVKYPDTILKRASAAMAWHGNFSYIVSGVITDGNGLVRICDIEKWNGNEWALLGVKTNLGLISPGCVCLSDDRILIVGGETEKNTYVNQVVVVEIACGGVINIGQMTDGTKCTYGQIKFVDNKAVVYHFGREILEFQAHLPLVQTIE